MQPHLTTSNQKKQYVYDRAGHRVASVIGQICYRTLHERHILREPPAVCFDLTSFTAARNAGAEVIVIHREDVGIKMLAKMEDYQRHGFQFDRGHGEQIGLALTYFQVIDKRQEASQVEQIALPLGSLEEWA